jgi:hypothetical protein
MQHAKKCEAAEVPRACSKPGCFRPPMNSRAYATHAGSHKGNHLAPYGCSKCDDRWYDLNLLVSHEMRCKGDDRWYRRVNGSLRVVFDMSVGARLDPSLIVVVTAS